MPSSTKNDNRSFLTNLIDHLRLPLYRNGYSLVFSSLASSALGMLYWILAARLYPAEIVGLNSAVISTAAFLANIAQLNLTNAMNRFLPAAGRNTRRLISVSYLISVVLAILSAHHRKHQLAAAAKFVQAA
ncbi:MAG TPA: hypothetical protein VHO48_07660, partial [Anaerolineaceae bacterium]|nr:hypothetical protein [Anaerolineaceae bacterium]